MLRLTTSVSLATFPLALLLTVACASSVDDDEQSPGGTGGAAESSSGGAGGGPGSAGAAGDAPAYPALACPADTQGFAAEVIDFTAGSGQDFGQADLPDIVLGGPIGGGESTGSFDVVSLGDGGSITLGFGDLLIVDGPGDDFIVFENAFAAQGGSVFAEPARVEVSEQGEDWVAFPCDEATASGCAGISPVLAHPSQGLEVALDPERAGGDAFDLAELGLSEVRYLRVVDLVGDDAVFDLDAVSVVNGACEAD